VHHVRVRIIRPAELGGPELERWRSLQEADVRLSNPFLSPEFVRTYGEHRPRVRVAVVEQDGRTVAFLPFERDGRSVARALGYRLADCQGVIGEDGAIPSMQDLLAAAGLSVFEFDHLLTHQADRVSVRSVAAPSPVIEVGEGYEAWIAEKRAASSRIKRALAKGRKLEREVGELRFTYDSTDHSDLEQLMSWKSAQYARTGRADTFARPWMRSLLHDLLDVRAEGFSVRLSRLDAGPRTVALYLCLRSPRMLASWFPVFDREFAVYSPGLVSALSLVRAAADDGISTIDLGKGHEDYKQVLKSGDASVSRGAAVRMGPSALLWYAHQAPRRAAFGLVGRSPKAFQLADAALRRAASLRGALSRS
jgi:CelD/BcsL family acetyltransferase involved in cellulose biosynthesis